MAIVATLKVFLNYQHDFYIHNSYKIEITTDFNQIKHAAYFPPSWLDMTQINREAIKFVLQRKFFFLLLQMNFIGKTLFSFKLKKI